MSLFFSSEMTSMLPDTGNRENITTNIAENSETTSFTNIFLSDKRTVTRSDALKDFAQFV